MLATLSRTLPPAHTDALFGYEMKWDGVRAVCYVDGLDLRILSRSDRDISGSYPELQSIAPALDGRRAVLDGEIVALDPATGQVSFGTLQQRMHVVDPTRAARLARQVPALFLAFSGLPAAVAWYLAGGWIAALAALVAPLPLSLVLALPYHLAAWGGRYGFAVTWRVLAYPLGYLAPLTAVPGLRWVAAAYAGVVLLAVGLAVAREVSFGRAFLGCCAISGLVLFGAGAVL